MYRSGAPFYVALRWTRSLTVRHRDFTRHWSNVKHTIGTANDTRGGACQVSSIQITLASDFSDVLLSAAIAGVYGDTRGFFRFFGYFVFPEPKSRLLQEVDLICDAGVPARNYRDLDIPH